jgi:hypothetical protein
MILKLQSGVSSQEIKSTNLWLQSYTNNFQKAQFNEVISNVIINKENGYVSFPLLFSFRKNGYVTINVSQFEAEIHGYTKQTKSKLSIPCANCTELRAFLFRNYLTALYTTKHYENCIADINQAYTKTYRALFVEMLTIKNQLSNLSDHPHDIKIKNSLKTSLKFTKAKISRVRFDRDVVKRFTKSKQAISIAA